jgi:diadenosine tetraphosphate (Ap4A) HIT family hydrolase
VQKFTVDAAIAAVTHALGLLKLSEARLMDDARYPWIVLVPRRTGARELEHLKPSDRAQLMEEIVLAGAAVRAMGAAAGRPVEKINAGSLGNITPQLHVHVVGRRADDPAWPGPVWGQGEAVRYDPKALEAALAAGRPILELAAATA